MTQKLLTTRLNIWQAEIIGWLDCLTKQYRVIDPQRIEQISDDEITIDGITFIRDGETIESGYFEQTSSGSRWEPPDYDFQYLSSTGEMNLPNFVFDTVKEVYLVHLGYAFGAEAEYQMHLDDIRLEKELGAAGYPAPPFYL